MPIGDWYYLVAMLVAGSVLTGLIARGVARDTATKAWRETAEALQARLDDLEAEVKQLREERAVDKRSITRLTRERDGLRQRVRLLTARVTELERRLRDAGIVDEHPPPTAISP